MTKNKSAKKLGFKKNDYALTKEGFVARLDSHLNSYSPFCEVWGLYHEFGSVSSMELSRISQKNAKRVINMLVSNGWAV